VYVFKKNGKTHWTGLPWTRDRSGAEVCLHTTFTKHIHASGEVEHIYFPKL